MQGAFQLGADAGYGEGRDEKRDQDQESGRTHMPAVTGS